MKNPSNIAHPLKNRTGTSQRNRVIQALGTDSAPIDGKTLADRLYLISEYARQLNYYQYEKTEFNGESQELDNWSVFFKDSLPFQLANLSKTSIDELEAQFLLLYEELKANPSKESLESLFNFIFNKIITPTTLLFKTIENKENSFTESLLAIIKTSFTEPIKSFICLYNSSTNFLCITKKNFIDFIKMPWQLKVDEDIYALDLCIIHVKKGKKEAFLKAGEILNTIFQQVLSGMQNIVIAAPDYIEESLIPLKESLQKKHEPHIALLFAFLELFKHFQGNINELSKKHLDFFYEQVLKMIPKDAVPDMAHMVFEVANHQKEYLLKKDLLLKDGKDSNKQDIQFGLDHEIVLDKAQVKDLRTLSLYPIKNNHNEKFIEGVYIAPKANSADGIDKDFKEDQAKNWPTLGSKYSKCILDGKETPEEYPIARLGFVLASPVLLLEEGKRIIEILLTCDYNNSNNLTQEKLDKEISKAIDKLVDQELDYYHIKEQILTNCADDLSVAALDYLTSILGKESPFKIYEFELDDFFKIENSISCKPIFTENDIKILTSCLGSKQIEKIPLFNIKFSGKEKWITSVSTTTVNRLVSGSTPLNRIQFLLIIELAPETPAVTFYDEEKLKEKIDLKESFPLVKIELNEKIKANCTFEGLDDNKNCCLKNEINSDDTISFSPYHFLKELVLVDAHIDVKVCGVKNLIVQNDDNLQDVNKPIQPFGPRPKVGGTIKDDDDDDDNDEWFVDGGANFYIGSKEIFCKNWQKFWINTTWKDKPQDLEDYYTFYKDVEFEDGSKKITNESFRFAASILDDGIWKKDMLTTPGIDIKHLDLLELFTSHSTVDNTCLQPKDLATYCHGMQRELPPIPDSGNAYIPKSMPFEELEPLTVNSRKGFAKLTLAGVAFQHEKYTYVLARQMMALADLVDPKSIKDALALLKITKEELIPKAKKLTEEIIPDLITVISTTTITTLKNSIEISITNLAKNVRAEINLAIQNLATPDIPEALIHLGHASGSINVLIDLLGDSATLETDPEVLGLIKKIESQLLEINEAIVNEDTGILHFLIEIEGNINSVCALFDPSTELGLPNEPYTPLIKSLSIDYHAIATKEDLDIIHLYPYENTSKLEDVENNPTLFPYFDKEGTLFIGIEKITKGGNLSMLFQLAEASADSELDRAKIYWHYLRNNNWEPLEYDFDVISDETDGFTISGITTIAVPDDINNKGNTVMPDPFYWVKVSAPENVKAVAETIGIHTQAAKTSARFNELSDKSRLENALEAGSIAKLVEGDFNVKKAEQIYPSFGGRKPEANGHFYTRVSEHLKHKGRALMLNDYEKIVLEGFPEIYKAKCITHTMGLSAIDYRRDLEIAPGYVVVTVIPDLTKLKSGNLQEPKVPISLLEKIGDHIRKRTSPFARLKVMNPRFEYVDVSITVRLYRGKSENFYKQKLKEDIKLFLAPWSLGDSEKLAFGQVILFSDIVGFVEQLDYVDFIVSLDLNGTCGQTGSIIKPLTARSVLTGGIICVDINKEECPEDKECIDNQESLSMVN